MEHKFVSKGWGYEKWIVNKSPNDIVNEALDDVGQGYCLKKMFLAKGKACSWHYHRVKNEAFYILDGKMLLNYISKEDMDRASFLPITEEYILLTNRYINTVILEKDDIFYIPPGMYHKFIGLEDTNFLEASTHHKDEDSVRIIKGD